MKFGGTSVQDAEAFARVAEIVGSQKDVSPVVVTSAMAKVTDALLNAFETAKKGDSKTAVNSLEQLLSDDLQVSQTLHRRGRTKSFFD